MYICPMPIGGKPAYMGEDSDISNQSDSDDICRAAVHAHVTHMTVPMMAASKKMKQVRRTVWPLPLGLSISRGAKKAPHVHAGLSIVG